jgi:hypothetical protein
MAKAATKVLLLEMNVSDGGDSIGVTLKKIEASFGAGTW